jgi:5-methylthioadenosine/S-adenosylhomocysteine deaminase
MEPVDSLIQARWVLPIEPGPAVLEDHAVAIRAGRIVDVLPIAQARARFDAQEYVDRPRHALLPGFVDAHARAATVLLRGRSGQSPLDSWRVDAAGPVEQHWAGPEYVRDGTELAICEMLLAGVTCFADCHPWPDVVALTAAELHVRASVGLVVAQGGTRWASDADDHIEKGLALRDEYRGDPLVTTHFAPDATPSMDDATLLRIRRLVDELESPLLMTLHAADVEIAQSLQRHGLRPLARLEKLGLATHLLVAVHLTQATAADLDALAGAGSAVVHCPQSNLRHGMGHCPVVELAGRGVRVALGTGGAVASNGLDVLAEARVASLLASGVSARPGALIASDVLRMATLEGARALGLGESTGSLVPGKWADLACVDLNHPGSWPVHDVAATLVHACSARQVTDVWVAGRQVVADRSLRYVDVEDVLDRAEAWRRRIDARPPGSEDHAETT